MSPLEIAVLRRKLSRMVESLSDLTILREMTLKEWRADAMQRAAAERWFQLCVDAAVDFNGHLLVALGHPAPADGFLSFLELARRTRVIDHDLAANLSTTVGLRNRIVHLYDDVDDALVLKGIGEAVRLFPRHVELISKYVEGLATT